MRKASLKGLTQLALNCAVVLFSTWGTESIMLGWQVLKTLLSKVAVICFDLMAIAFLQGSFPLCCAIIFYKENKKYFLIHATRKNIHFKYQQ